MFLFFAKKCLLFGNNNGMLFERSVSLKLPETMGKDPAELRSIQKEGAYGTAELKAPD